MEIDLHSNAVIERLVVESDSHIDSIAPEYIETDSLSFRPIFQIDFQRVVELLRNVSDEVFSYHGANRHMFPRETREYVQSQANRWKSGVHFDYGVLYDGELIGVAFFSPDSDYAGFEIGLWLRKEYWGQELSQERADAFINILFSVFDASFVFVGCALPNVASRRSIEKYIRRYNGSFFGCDYRSTGYYEQVEDPIEVIPHPDWGISNTQFHSEESGINTTIPGVSYSDVDFE